MSSSSSSVQARALYRELLRWGQRFPQYNFREFALRRTRERFRLHQTEEGPRVAELLQEAEEQLALLKRQVQVSSLYPAEDTVVNGKR